MTQKPRMYEGCCTMKGGQIYNTFNFMVTYYYFFFNKNIPHTGIDHNN